MTKKRLFELRKKYQALTDEALRVLNCGMDVEVLIEETEDNTLGEFWVEAAESRGELRGFKGFIQLDDFTKYKKDDLIEYLFLQILIHEIGHALQFRRWEMIEETEEEGAMERDSDHDAEFGIHFARAYQQVIENSEPSQEEAMDIIGLTPERREAIVESLTQAIQKDEENADEEPS